ARAHWKASPAWGVPPPPRRLGLAAEPLPLGLAGELARQDPLERHQPTQLAMAGLVDDPHPAAADLTEDDVGPHLARRRGQLALGGRLRAPRLPPQGPCRALPVSFCLPRSPGS